MNSRMDTAKDSGPMFTLSDVSFNYAGGRPGVRDVSLRIPTGALVAVIGANGSGKSTLLRLIAGILSPQRGTILLGGRDPLRRTRALARRIAYVPQTHDIVFPFPVLDVVLAGRAPHTSRFRFETDEDRRIALTCLREVGVDHLAHRPVTELSVGERQLVSIARGLAQQPECLLLDEPTAALDLTHRWRVIRIVQRLRSDRRLTTLFVTHDVESLDESFDQVIAMQSGAIVAVGTPSSVIRQDRLGQIYGDSTLATRRIEGRTFIWSRPDA